MMYCSLCLYHYSMCKEYSIYVFVTCSSIMSYFQCIMLLLAFGSVIIQDDYFAAASDMRSVDHLPTYIVHFHASTTDTLQQHFVKQLIGNHSTVARIVAEYPSIKCLTARLSERALKWVRILSDSSIICLNDLATLTVIQISRYGVLFVLSN